MADEGYDTPGWLDPDAEESERPMPPRMIIFADEWLTGANTGKQFHGTAAYEFAGYKLSESNPHTNASKLLRHPKVREYIKKRMDEHAMDATEVLLRMSAIARAQAGDVVALESTPDGGHKLVIDPEEVIKNSQFIKSFGYDASGNPKIEFHDALSALRDVAKIRGMMKDGVEITGAGGGAIIAQIQFVAPDGQSFVPGGIEPVEQDEEDFSDLEND